MMGKLIFLSTLICVVALLLNIEYSAKIVEIYLPSLLSAIGMHNSLLGVDRKTVTTEEKVIDVKIFTQSELAEYKGQDGGKVYLAIVGHVYDVTSGKKHYGPGGGYEFFSGIDGSKAYVTGEFDLGGLVDDISSLSSSAILGLEQWKEFYDKDYKFVGRVVGSFFDEKGKELPMMHEYKRKLHMGKQEKNLIEKDKQLFPPCNSEWSQDMGGRVWCSTLSGGINRDWVGVPRMYYTTGSSKPRCACVRTFGPPSNDMTAKSHRNRGDLDNPNLNMYPNCPETSESCPLPL